MNKYDLTLLVREVAGVVEKIEKVVKMLGGKVVKTAEMGKKPLAYQIKKAGEAHYLSMLLELPGEAVVQLKKKLTVDHALLRYMLIKVQGSRFKTQ